MEDNRYSNGKIYRLVNTVDEEFYIGSTCNMLAKRLHMHKRKAKKHINRRVYAHLNNIGWEHVSIVLIEEYACGNKMELERKEREVIEQLKPSLNRYIPARTQEEKADKVRERATRYRAENADKVRERKAKYYADNADVLRERHAKYRVDNADKVRETQAKYRAENADKAREYQAKYRETNRDKINAKDRERRALKKQQSQP